MALILTEQGTKQLIFDNSEVAVVCICSLAINQTRIVIDPFRQSLSVEMLMKRFYEGQGPESQKRVNRSNPSSNFIFCCI